MKLAIMQPYLFPYFGYFQLINYVDKFIFYDDVNFIKNGWINRNRILINGSPSYFTVQLKDASPNKLIKDVEFTDNREKLLKTITMSYKKAPFFGIVCPVIEEVMNYKTTLISKLAIESVIKICEFLNISTTFEISNEIYSETANLHKVKRLIKICNLNKASTYVNPPGGKEIYDKSEFSKERIELLFLEPEIVEYKQFNNNFVSGLSIIDLIMFNDKSAVRDMLKQFNLI